MMMMSTRKAPTLLVLLLLLVLAAQSVSQGQQEDGCADVVGGTATQSSSDGSWTIAATVSSSYETGWDKYANEWKAESSSAAVDGGTLLGTRTLAHPHVNEQPFTRSLSGVVIPDEVSVIILSAQDSVSGYCGESFELTLPGRAGEEIPIVLEGETAEGVDAEPAPSATVEDNTGEVTLETAEAQATSSGVVSKPWHAAIMAAAAVGTTLTAGVLLL